MVLGTKVLGTPDRDEIQSWLYLFLELMMIQSYSKLVVLSKKLRVQEVEIQLFKIRR